MVAGFERNLAILQNSMSANRMRSQTIANNIANAETPHFKRSEINFEAELGRALRNEEAARRNPPLQARQTHHLHTNFPQPRSWQQVEARRRLDYLSEVNNNGNNVDLEREAQLATMNSLSYEMLTELVNFQFRQITAVIRG